MEKFLGLLVKGGPYGTIHVAEVLRQRRMKMFKKLIASILFTIVGFGFAGSVVAVEHPEGEVFERTIFEDDSVLVTELILQPGASLGRHSNLFPCIVHVVEGALTIVLPDGGRRVLGSDSFLAIPASREHYCKNESDRPSTIRLILLKERLWVGTEHR